MTRQLLSPDDLETLFPAVQRSSWRWECQPQYAVDAAALEAWIAAGKPAAIEHHNPKWRPWLDFISGLRARNIPFERVRVRSEPPNLYQQWIFVSAAGNVGAGEDIRWLNRSRANAHNMPTYDFYLFDENRVAIMRFEGDGVLTGLELDDDPDVVREHLGYKARVWHEATPHRLAVTGSAG